MWTGFILGLVLLFLGAEILVRGAVALAARLKISPTVVGLTVVAYGTSLPEAGASALAGARGVPGVAVGNVVGSNVANVLLVVGATCLVRPLPLGPELRGQIPLMVGLSLAVPLSLLFGGVSRVDAALLACAIVAYAWINIARSRASTRGKQDLEPNTPGHPEARIHRSWLAIGVLTLGGMITVPFGANLFINAAADVARALGVSDATVGLTLVALATSLPELATSLASAIKGEVGLAVGNVVGSNCFNALGVLAVAGLIHPLEVEIAHFGWDIAVMMGAAVWLWGLEICTNVIRRPVGLAMLVGYLLYVTLVATAHPVL